jgi:hypothetical protein
MRQADYSVKYILFIAPSRIFFRVLTTAHTYPSSGSFRDECLNNRLPENEFQSDWLACVRERWFRAGSPKYQNFLTLPKMAKSRAFLNADAGQDSRASSRMSSYTTIKGNFGFSLSLVSALALVLVPLVQAENSARTPTSKSAVRTRLVCSHWWCR